MVENEIFTVAMEIYLKAKKGETFEESEKPRESTSYPCRQEEEEEQNYDEEKDIYGKPIEEHAPPVIDCVNCSAKVACNRFAPHLERCMGFGRTSSRLASRKISRNADFVVCGRRLGLFRR